MEENPLSTSQVFAVGNIEYLISVFYNAPEDTLKKIMELVDEHKIAEHKETMNYFHEMLTIKGYVEYAREFAKKYAIQSEKS
jgi:hypothetical protein